MQVSRPSCHTNAAQIDNASATAQLAPPTPTPPVKRPKDRLRIGSLLVVLFNAAFYIVRDGVFRCQTYRFVDGHRVSVRTSAAGIIQKVYVAKGLCGKRSMWSKGTSLVPTTCCSRLKTSNWNIVWNELVMGSDWLKLNWMLTSQSCVASLASVNGTYSTTLPSSLNWPASCQNAVPKSKSLSQSNSRYRVSKACYQIWLKLFPLIASRKRPDLGRGGTQSR